MITRHTVGNALVLHVSERISTEARTVALSVDRDPDNDIVILDLQHELPFDIWDTVATELRRQRLRRGIRLVVCGARPETGALAGQWLSDRLGRPVIAPFGRMIPGAAGLLFVHAEDLGGWVCYRRGHTPVWQSKRYPVPAWDGAAVDHLTISSTCAAEPLPGGVWLRESRDEAAVAVHGSHLTSTMPCLPDAMPVLVGCPGTAPLRLDDIARFWRGLAPEGREHARFVQYGPVALPDGEQFGQALADLLRCPVRVFTGVPSGRPGGPAMFTVDADGRPGWQVFAEELAYRPRETLGAKAVTPRILRHRAPPELGEPVGPRVYQYAHDAVVEVIPSGLWLRAPEPPRHADRIRAVPMDPDRVRLVVDDPASAVADRHRELAGDLAARLDPATRRRAAVQPSSLVAPGRPGLSARGIEAGTYRHATAHAADLLPAPSVPAPVPEAVPVAVAGPAAPATDEAADVGAALASAGSTASPDEAGLNGAGPIRAGLNGAGLNGAGPNGAGLNAAGPNGAGLNGAGPDGAGPDGAGLNGARLHGAGSDTDGLHGAGPDVARLHGAGPDEALPDDAGPRVAGSGTAGPHVAVPDVAGPAGPVLGGGAGWATSPTMTLPVHRPAPAPVRFQRTPADDARGVRPGPDLDEERTWFRRAFRREIAAVAADVAGVLAAHPGLGGGADATEYATAVRLYLSAAGDGLDQALRSAEPGGHVPFARCVSAGVRRLPAHRGVAYAAAELTTADLRRIAQRRVLTDWGFTNALAEPPADLPGTVEVLVWSATARRTAAFEPGDGVPARVLFLPGTAFTVLQVQEPEAGAPARLLLRELAVEEPPVDGRVRFDALALAALRQHLARRTGPGTPVPAAAARRFVAVPGLR
ncbi:hypothetical protein [Micromonospora sp. C28ISP2-4]|uniref:hypothetical protein n=1 Tax=Micromonospora sp. C28ISP2-4 TaxID=3059523 RepID=UPI00267635A4|nr:hypothetical protein [Micromonospora sp. C28ISP2-4]MDO3686643.1 hypothetical protein [Micromonospora sp. C28ISP2-4]